MNPTEDQALQFAIMLQSGLPAGQAIQYFSTSEDPMEVSQMLQKWLRSKLVKQAQTRLMGKPWTEMTLDERCDKALEQQYSSMAYLLFSVHYGDANAAEKGKLDAARQALEARKAGTAGKGSPLDQFLMEFTQKRGSLKNAPLSGSGASTGASLFGKPV